MVSIKTDTNNIYTEDVPIYEEVLFKKAASNYELPLANGAASSKRPEAIDAKPCPAYGINTISPNLGQGNEGQEGMDGTPSNGKLLPPGPNILYVYGIFYRHNAFTLV